MCHHNTILSIEIYLSMIIICSIIITAILKDLKSLQTQNSYKEKQSEKWDQLQLPALLGRANSPGTSSPGTSSPGTNSTLHTPYNIWHSDRKGQVSCSKENIENEILTQKPMSSKIWKCKKIEK